jgi:protein SCO1
MTALAKRFHLKEAAALACLSLILTWVLLSFQTAAFAGASKDAANKFEKTAALKLSQAAIGVKLRDHRFVNADGKSLRLSDFAGKPLIISLIYTSCYNTCPQITQSLARGVEIANDALGKNKFNIVTIGFDAEFDKPSTMRSFRRQQDIDFDNWQFLSTDVATVWRMSDDIGFSFTPSTQGFDHLTQTTILDHHGKVFAQVYGDDFPVPQLVEPLKSLVLGDGSWTGVKGTLASIIDSVRLACTVYDPQRDAYRFDYSIFIGMTIGFFSISGIIAFVIRNLYLGRRRRLNSETTSENIPSGGKPVTGTDI